MSCSSNNVKGMHYFFWNYLPLLYCLMPLFMPWMWPIYRCHFPITVICANLLFLLVTLTCMDGLLKPHYVSVNLYCICIYTLWYCIVYFVHMHACIYVRMYVRMYVCMYVCIPFSSAGGHPAVGADGKSDWWHQAAWAVILENAAAANGMYVCVEQLQHCDAICCSLT